jgi:hypothetical protein
MAIFHFQLLGAAGWEAVGAGVGDGEDPVDVALAELRDLCGGHLPAGRWRVIESHSADPRLETFEVDEAGAVHDDGPHACRR